MSAGLTAIRYARALIGLIEDKAQLTEVRRALEEISLAILKSPQFRRLLTRPDTDLQSKQKAVQQLLQADYPLPLLGLLDDLIATHRLKYLPAISREFTRLMDQKLGILRAVVTSPLQLTQAMREEILKGLAQTHKSTIELIERVDPAILGGLTIQAGHRLLDTSVRQELYAMKQSLLHSTTR